MALLLLFWRFWRFSVSHTDRVCSEMSSSATPGGGVVSIALVWSPKIQQTLGILIRETKVLRNGTMHTVTDVQLYINKPGEEREALKPHPTAALPTPTHCQFSSPLPLSKGPTEALVS